MIYNKRILSMVFLMVVMAGWVQAASDKPAGLKSFFKTCVSKNDDKLIEQAESYMAIASLLKATVESAGVNSADIEYGVLDEKALFNLALAGFGDLEGLSSYREYVSPLVKEMADMLNAVKQRLSFEQATVDEETVKSLMMREDIDVAELDMPTRMCLFVQNAEQAMPVVCWLDKILREHSEYFDLFATCNSLLMYYENEIIIPEGDEFAWLEQLNKTIVVREFAERNEGWFAGKAKPYHSFARVLEKNIKRVETVCTRMKELNGHYGSTSNLNFLAQDLLQRMQMLLAVVNEYMR